MGGDTWIFFAIIGYVIGVSWLARHVALDMDARGKPGGLYGMTTLLLPPLGLGLWLMDRDRPEGRVPLGPKLGTVPDVVFFILLIVTFPWGLIAWMLLNRRAGSRN